MQPAYQNMGKASAHSLGPAGPLLRPPVLEQVVHNTARDPPNPKTTGRSGGPGGQPEVHPAHPDVWKVSRHGLGAVGPLLWHPVSVGNIGAIFRLIFHPIFRRIFCLIFLLIFLDNSA